MTELEKLIEIAHHLSDRLDNMLREEMKFCVEIQIRLEFMSWEIYRTANELNEIKNYI
jgi:hypothetical protein